VEPAGSPKPPAGCLAAFLLPFVAAFLVMGVTTVVSEHFRIRDRSDGSYSYIAHGGEARRIGAAWIALGLSGVVWLVRGFTWNRWRGLRWRRSSTLVALGAFLAAVATGLGPWHYAWAPVPTVMVLVPAASMVAWGLGRLAGPAGRRWWFRLASMLALAAFIATIVRYGAVMIAAWPTGGLITAIIAVHLWLLARETGERSG